MDHTNSNNDHINSSSDESSQTLSNHKHTRSHKSQHQQHQTLLQRKSQQANQSYVVKQQHYNNNSNTNGHDNNSQLHINKYKHSDHTHDHINVNKSSIYNDNSNTAIRSNIDITQFTSNLHDEQSLDIIQRIINNNYECTICSEIITSKQYVWNCIQCFTMIHLSCIQRYYGTIKKQLSITSQQSQTTLRCPHCAFLYIDEPTQYYCFCQNEIQPDNIQSILPHSCGKLCNKLLNCNIHSCTSLCHPGRCDKCNKPGNTVTCNCGKSTYTLRCGENDTYNKSCGNICNKRLNCLLNHTCQDICHTGQCGLCTVQTKQSCYCGRHNDIVQSCGLADSYNNDNNTLYYSCNEICGKKLSCGNHYCSLPCHIGNCETCPRQPSLHQTCACGQTTVNMQQSKLRASCSDPLPTCNKICNKTLSCNRHQCKLRCHDSPCPDICNQTLQLACRCLRNVIDVKCVDYDKLPIDTTTNERIVTCKTRCTQKLSCGQCICNTFCCSPAFNAQHLCTKLCNKLLACGLHNCDSFHHTGKCNTCKVNYPDGIACACGKTRTMPNTVCGTLIRPSCQYPCTQKRDCGHSCTYACHSGACPPCVVLCSKICAGNHKLLHNMPCYATSPSCGQKCNKPLQCGQHTCAKNCHNENIVCGLTAISQLPALNNSWTQNKQLNNNNNQQQQSNTDLSNTVKSCGQKCNAIRQCSHKCQQKCHPNEPCNESIECNERITITCQCQRKTQTVKCSQSNKVNFQCDAECSRQQRNNALKNALNINDKQHNNNIQSLPYPTQLLDSIIAADLISVLPKAEKMVCDFAMSDELSYNCKSLGKGNSNTQRWLLHQLCEWYGVLSESLDVGSQRSIRLIKNTYCTPRKPVMSLYDAVNKYKNNPAIRQAAQQNNIHNILHLYGSSYPPILQTNDLNTILRNIVDNSMYQINWVNDIQHTNNNNHTTMPDHIIITFHNITAKQNVINALIKRKMFQYEPSVELQQLYQHDNNISGIALYRCLAVANGNKISNNNNVSDSWDTDSMTSNTTTTTTSSNNPFNRNIKHSKTKNNNTNTQSKNAFELLVDS